jgi:hypothetical protein
MRGAGMLIVAVLAAALLAGPALAQRSNAKPTIISAHVVSPHGHAVKVRIVGRDRDDVVRGAEIRWGDGQPAQGDSACQLSSDGRGDESRRGKRARFTLSYAYPAAGDYTVTVRVLSGGCGKRPQQRSSRRRLTVHVR